MAKEKIELNEDKEKIENEDRVEVLIPRAKGNEDPNFFVAVNGVNYLLPRGKRVKVPAHVAAEIERAEQAQDAWDNKSAAMADAASK